MGKRKARKQRKGLAKVQQVHKPVVQESTGCSFHVLAYGRRAGQEIALCLDCEHVEPWIKAKGKTA